MAQKSKAVGVPNETVEVQLPVPSSEVFAEVTSAGQVIVGLVLSFTVTTVVQVELFPDASVTVRVMVLSPIFAHVRTEGDTDIISDPEEVQLSVLPPSTCEGARVIDGLRFAGRFFEKGALQTAVGGILSTTVTTAVPVAVLFNTLSFTVRVTVLAPTLIHENDVLLSDLVIEQPEVLPSSMSDNVSVAEPEASR